MGSNQSKCNLLQITNTMYQKPLIKILNTAIRNVFLLLKNTKIHTKYTSDH